MGVQQVWLAREALARGRIAKLQGAAHPGATRNLRHMMGGMFRQGTTHRTIHNQGSLRAAFSLLVAPARYNLNAVADAPMSHQEIGQMHA